MEEIGVSIFVLIGGFDYMTCYVETAEDIV